MVGESTNNSPIFARNLQNSTMMKSTAYFEVLEAPVHLSLEHISLLLHPLQRRNRCFVGRTSSCYDFDGLVNNSNLPTSESTIPSCLLFVILRTFLTRFPCSKIAYAKNVYKGLVMRHVYGLKGKQEKCAFG